MSLFDYIKYKSINLDNIEEVKELPSEFLYHFWYSMGMAHLSVSEIISCISSWSRHPITKDGIRLRFDRTLKEFYVHERESDEPF